MADKLSKEFSKEDGLKLVSFLTTGYDDYLSARILINNGLLLQGAILANTAIEKCLKAIVTFMEGKLKYSHKTTLLLEAIKDFDTKLYNQINQPFVALIEKAYQMRYIDSLSNGFRICLVRRNVLAELDSIISLLANKIKLKNETKYEVDKKANKPSLYENNFVLNNIDKNEFLIGLDDAFEFIVDEKIGFFEVSYQFDFKG